MKIIQEKYNEVLQICMALEVKELYGFGSMITDNLKDDSDLDFVVSFDIKDPLEYAEKYFELKFKLEEIFQRKIDLLEDRSIENKQFKNHLDNQKVLVYERQPASMA